MIHFRFGPLESEENTTTFLILQRGGQPNILENCCVLCLCGFKLVKNLFSRTLILLVSSRVAGKLEL